MIYRAFNLLLRLNVSREFAGVPLRSMLFLLFMLSGNLDTGIELDGGKWVIITFEKMNNQNVKESVKD